MRKFLWLAAAIAFAPAAAFANPVNVEEGTFGGGVEGNFVFNPCTDPRPAAINDGVVGCVNAAPTNYIYVYGDEALESAGGGQATVVDVAGDGFDTITIDFVDNDVFFTQLAVNIFAQDTGGGTVDFGNGFVFDFDDTGSHQFIITFEPGVNSYTFSATSGFWVDIRQIRFRFGDTDVPEPGMLGLLGLGLVGIGLARRRRI